MFNLYKRLLNLVAGPPMDVGHVLSIEPDGVIIEVLNGAQLRIRGTAAVGDWVYVRGGAVDGPAPNLPGVEIEV